MDNFRTRNFLVLWTSLVPNYSFCLSRRTFFSSPCLFHLRCCKLLCKQNILTFYDCYSLRFLRCLLVFFCSQNYRHSKLHIDTLPLYANCIFRSSQRRCSVTNFAMFLEISQNSSENTCARVSFLIKLQVSAQMFSCECCEISINTFFKEHLNQYLHTARNSTAFQCLDFNVAKWSSRLVNETLVGNVCKLLANL